MKDIKFLTDEPIVTVEQIVGWEYALDAARFTMGKELICKKPSEAFIKKSIMAEHSQIKLVQYRIIIKNLKQWVGVHLLRHEHMLPFINSQRNDRNESVEWMVEKILGELLHMIREEQPDFNPRNLLPQGTNNNHMFWLNAQTFINISRRRLCHEASKETRMIWQLIIKELSKVDPILPQFLVPMCVYRGFCPEMSSCGYCLSDKFKSELTNYHNLIPPVTKRIKK